MVYIVPAFLFVAMIFIPESPRWLILQGRYDEGLKALKWLRPKDADVDNELNEIRDAINKEEETAKGVGILDMFNNPIDRRRSLLSIGAVGLQASSGSMFIIGESLDPISNTQGRV